MWVGWVTPDYHQHDMNFDLSKVRAVTVTMGDEQGNIHSRCQGGVGTVGCGRSALGTWLRRFHVPSSPLFLFIFLQWLLLCFFPPLLFPFLLFCLLFLCHLTLLFLHDHPPLFSPLAPLPSPPSRILHQLLRILAPRGSGSGVRASVRMSAGGKSLRMGSEVMVF